ncbi:MAG: hypothetical protein HPM95_04260 [Alphaproteobacteria bacterium]|nr:hypothetical protein [Alphaproteobacteria bacterium]
MPFERLRPQGLSDRENGGGILRKVFIDATVALPFEQDAKTASFHLDRQSINIAETTPDSKTRICNDKPTQIENSLAALSPKRPYVFIFDLYNHSAKIIERQLLLIQP